MTRIFLSCALSAGLVLAPSLIAQRVQLRFDSRNQALEATGLDPSLPRPTLSVYLGDAKTPILGDYEITGTTLRFTPRFPFLPGRTHRARLEVGDTILNLTFSPAPAALAPKTRVVRISPSADAVPANLLRVYIHFSHPMSRRGIARYIRLTEAGGAPVADPFLEMDDGLWDPESRRLTVLFHPGRIKRGLALHDNLGLALEPGKRYRLLFAKEAEDVDGSPLIEDFVKEFAVLPEDRTSPDPAKWTIQAPRAGGRDPLSITADKPLDEALFARMLQVEDADGHSIAGESLVESAGTRWRFVPRDPWRPGRYRVRAGAQLEDLADNRLTRLFDEPARSDGERTEAREAVLRFVVSR